MLWIASDYTTFASQPKPNFDLTSSAAHRKILHYLVTNGIPEDKIVCNHQLVGQKLVINFDFVCYKNQQWPVLGVIFHNFQQANFPMMVDTGKQIFQNLPVLPLLLIVDKNLSVYLFAQKQMGKLSNILYVAEKNLAPFTSLFQEKNN